MLTNNAVKRIERGEPVMEISLNYREEENDGIHYMGFVANRESGVIGHIAEALQFAGRSKHPNAGFYTDLAEVIIHECGLVPRNGRP